MSWLKRVMNWFQGAMCWLKPTSYYYGWLVIVLVLFIGGSAAEKQLGKYFQEAGVVVAFLGIVLEAMREKRAEKRQRQWESNTKLLEALALYDLEDPQEEAARRIVLQLKLAYLDREKSFQDKMIKILNEISGPYISERQVITIFKIVKEDLAPLSNQGDIEKVLKIFDNLLEPKSPAQHIALPFLKGKPSSATSKKIKTILQLCDKKIGEEISKEEIMQEWAKHDLDDESGPVTKHLKSLYANRRATKNTLESLLKFESETFKFKVEKEKEAVLKEVLDLI